MLKSVFIGNWVKIVDNFLVSLILATLMSFTASVILVGGILGILLAVSYIPGLVEFGREGAIQVLDFLATFGNGKPLQGMLTLAVTVSIVGILLDILNFYRYQSLRD